MPLVNHSTKHNRMSKANSTFAQVIADGAGHLAHNGVAKPKMIHHKAQATIKNSTRPMMNTITEAIVIHNSLFQKGWSHPQPLDFASAAVPTY
jgi:di/tripeptidase